MLSERWRGKGGREGRTVKAGEGCGTSSPWASQESLSSPPQSLCFLWYSGWQCTSCSSEGVQKSVYCKIIAPVGLKHPHRIPVFHCSFFQTLNEKQVGSVLLFLPDFGHTTAPGPLSTSMSHLDHSLQIVTETDSSDVCNPASNPCSFSCPLGLVGIEPRTSCMLVKCFILEPHPKLVFNSWSSIHFLGL